MRARPPRLVALAFVVAAALIAGCLRKTSYQQCTQASDCAGAGDGARCESNHACSFDDGDCPSGHRYHASAGDSAGLCVDLPDAPPPPPDAPPVVPAAGRECVPGIPLPPTYGDGCAQMVDDKEPRCGTELWDDVCVHWAELLCQKACSSMAVIATTDSPLVIRMSDHAIIWQDPANLGDGEQGVAWGDYDNDGDPDLAIVSRTTLRILRNDGWNPTTAKLDLEPFYTKNWSGIAPDFPQFGGADVAWVDVNHDGHLDVAFSGEMGLVVFQNDDGVFTPQTPIVLPTVYDDGGVYTPSLAQMAWGDTDHDHFPELAVMANFRPTRFFHNEHDAMKEVEWTNDSVLGGGVEWCNLDSVDPEPELVMSGYDFVRVFDTVGGAPTASFTTLDSRLASDVQCADFDHDGDLDVIVSGHSAAPTRVFTHHPNTLGGFGVTWNDGAAMSGAWNVAVGNLDGDPDLDVLVTGNNSDQPITFQVFDNVTAQKNLVHFASKPLVQLADPPAVAVAMKLAPLMGAP